MNLPCPYSRGRTWGDRLRATYGPYRALTTAAPGPDAVMLQRSLCPTLKPREAYDENEPLPYDARAGVEIVERYVFGVKLLNSFQCSDILGEARRDLRSD